MQVKCFAYSATWNIAGMIGGEEGDEYERSPDPSCA
jgi:hypothetical protein